MELELVDPREAQDSQENSPDQRAIKWGEALRSAEKKPHEVVGEFMMGGAKIINFVPDERVGRLRNPRVEDGVRKMILITGDIYGGVWGAKSLEQGLLSACSIDSLGSMGKKLFMVPYPRFDEKGDIDVKKSRIFIFDDQQIEDLKTLVND